MRLAEMNRLGGRIPYGETAAENKRAAAQPKRNLSRHAAKS
jgi:hypothetical protein